MAEDWVDVPAAPSAAAAPAPASDGWENVPAAGEQSPQAPISGPGGWSTAAKGMVNSTSVGSIMRAFGEGFGEAWGPERLGLSKENTEYLSKAGIFAPAGQKHYENPFQAFNEGVIVNTASALDAAIRLPSALYRGAQSAGVEAGLPKDIVSLPDAFAGSPGALGEIRMRSGLPKDAPVGKPLAELSPAPAPGFDAFHGSPYSFDAFSTEHIGKGEGAQAYGHGLYFAENEEVAVGYREQLKQWTIGGKPADETNPLHVAAVTLEHYGDKAKAIEDLEFSTKHGPQSERDVAAKAIDLIKEDAPLPKAKASGNLYQVRINVDQDRMLDWDKPLSEQSQYVRDALVRADAIKEYGSNIKEAGDARGSDIYQAIASRFENEKDTVTPPTERDVQMDRAASQLLSEAGIPGIKYLDAGSRSTGDGSRNLVVFNERDIEITHKNGEPIPTPQDAINQAKDLGVIGPERPPITEGTPKEAAERVTSANADQPPGEKVTQELPGQQDAWQQRFEGFVNKLEAPADVQQLIKDAAKENGDFMPARQGEIPLSHVEGIAEAAGVAPDEINARGLGRKLQNDNEVRVAMQMMLQVTDDVKNAAREVKADGSPENLIKLQQSIMRRDLAVEQVVGLRAEWGRTGNVIQEFTRDVKDQQGLSDFLKGKGRTPADLRDIAHTIDALDGPQAARMLNDLRTPTAWDKFKYYWVNALISGPVTHAKYIVANGAFAAYESAVVTPVAGAVGAVRRGLRGDVEGVYMGEAAARTWGIVAGVPDALKAAVSAAKTGMQTPLPGELAQGIIPKQNKNLAFQQKPIPGALGTVIGAPSRGASAIHSFFNFLGYRASIEAQAYRQAAKEGLSLSDDAFWQRRATTADTPTPEMMNSAIEEGYKLTYIAELGETGKKLSSFVNSTKVGQLIMPFTHIPLNILKRALEGTPAAFLDSATRDELTGAKGAAKQDMAIARMVAGSAVGAWAVNQVLNERMTGFGPTDPKERAQWLATGHQPYSIRIGDYWYSFNRFGSLGTMLGLYSNLAEVIPHMKPDAEELTKAIGMAVHSTGRLMEDEVGMQGLAGLMDAINEPDKKGVRFVSNFAGSLLPYSSMQRQIASSMDPYMRDTKSVVDGLRYYIPGQRQGLLPKRDWSGLPVANAGYGGDTAIPGASSIIQHRYGVADPVAQEMATLDLHPAPPQNRISGVKLPPKIYDTYQATAGAFTRSALEHFVEQPGWHDLPPFIREKMFRATIEATRKSAGAAVQMQYPEIIQQGVTDRVAKINGVKPTKLQDR